MIKKLPGMIGRQYSIVVKILDFWFKEFEFESWIHHYCVTLDNLHSLPSLQNEDNKSTWFIGVLRG